MTLYRSIGAALETDLTGTNPIDVRKGLGGLFIRPGVLPGSTSPLVAGTAGWAYSLGGPATWVTQTATGDGFHLWGNDGAVIVGTSGVGGTVPAAPGAGLSRIDILWIRHPSNNENGDTTSAPAAGVAVGTAASSPTAPALPAGAFEVARNTMTSAATTTVSTGNTITQTAPYTAAAGVLDPAVVGRVTAPSAEIYTSYVQLVAAPAIIGDGVKRFKITATFLYLVGVAGEVYAFTINDNGTVVRSGRLTVQAITTTDTMTFTMTTVPSAGSHIYTLRAVRVGGTGAGGHVNASATEPIEIIVEQIA